MACPLSGGVEITPLFCVSSSGIDRLTAEAIQGTSLTLQSVHNIESCDSLPAGVLCVCDSVTDDILQEHLEDTPGLLVD